MPLPYSAHIIPHIKIITLFKYNKTTVYIVGFIVQDYMIIRFRFINAVCILQKIGLTMSKKGTLNLHIVFRTLIKK